MLVGPRELTLLDQAQDLQHCGRKADDQGLENGAEGGEEWERVGGEGEKVRGGEGMGADVEEEVKGGR